MLGYASVQDLLAVNMRDLYRTASERVELIKRFAGARYGETESWKRQDGTTITGAA